MKIIVLSAVLFAAGLISSRGAEVTITGFGLGKENPLDLSTDLEGQWQGNGMQSATEVDFTNVSDESGNGIFSKLTTDGRSPVDVGSNTAYMLLTATLTSAPPAVDQFSISLFDAESNELDYTFGWSSFESGGADGTTVIAKLSDEPEVTFDGTAVSYALNLFDAAGSQPTNFGVNFFDMSVEDSADIPEPSSCALLLLGGSGVALVRRRVRNCPTHTFKGID